VVKRRFLPTACLLCVLFTTAFSTHAKESMELPALRPANTYRAGEFIVNTLLSIRHAPFQSSLLTTEEAPPGSHIRFLYQSADTALVEFGNIGTPPTERLIAVLPPAPVQGDILLPLYRSPYWSAYKNGIMIKLYSFIDTPVTILGAAMEDRETILSRIIVPLQHFFLRESFGATSTNYLFGYRINTVRLTTILGILELLWFLAAIRIRRQSVTVGFCIVFLPLLLFYEGRFLLDVAAATVEDQREWLTQGTYSEMGHLYQMGDILRSETAEDSIVAVCDRTVTPLKYLLHPVPVAVDEETWKRATHGIVLSIWDPNVKTVTCGEVTRDVANVLAQFANGTTVVSLKAPTR